MAIHPPGPLEPPVFRGVSDIGGDIGDVASGTYRRSDNIDIVNATTIGKRSGFQPAIDERFYGAPVLVSHRSADGTRYQIVGDADGVKILTLFAPRPVTDILDGAGFPHDDFDRADSATVQGGDPYEQWSENVTGSYVAAQGSEWEISSNACILTRTSSGTDTGTLEKPSVANSPFYVCAVELDLNAFTPSTTQTDNLLQFNIGMPPALWSGGVELKKQIKMADAIWDRTGLAGGSSWILEQANDMWSGMAVLVTMYYQSGTSNPTIRIRSAALVSDQPVGSTVTPYGYLTAAYVRDDIYTFDNLAAMQDVHTLEFGREASTAQSVGGQGFRQRTSFWANKALDEFTGYDTADVVQTFGENGVVALNVPFTGAGRTLQHIMPWGQVAQSLGFYGQFGKVTRASGTQAVGLRKIAVTGTFI